jgi:uncharacterized protein (TIGR03435 family)
LEKTAMGGRAVNSRWDASGDAGSYAADDSQPDVIASIFASIQGLGLKLESAKGPVETLVIDHAEKASEN